MRPRSAVAISIGITRQGRSPLAVLALQPLARIIEQLPHFACRMQFSPSSRSDQSGTWRTPRAPRCAAAHRYCRDGLPSSRPAAATGGTCAARPCFPAWSASRQVGLGRSLRGPCHHRLSRANVGARTRIMGAMSRTGRVTAVKSRPARREPRGCNSNPAKGVRHAPWPGQSCLVRRGVIAAEFADTPREVETVAGRNRDRSPGCRRAVTGADRCTQRAAADRETDEPAIGAPALAWGRCAGSGFPPNAGLPRVVDQITEAIGAQIRSPGPSVPSVISTSVLPLL